MLENIDRSKLYVIILIVIGLVIAGFIFYLVFKPAPVLPPVSNQNMPPGILPPVGLGNVNVGYIGPTNLPPSTTRPVGTLEQPATIAAGGVTTVKPVTQIPAKAPLALTNATRYYNSLDGKFYELTAGGSSRLLSEDAYLNAQKITWSSKGDSAILEFPDGANILYDFNKQKQFTLPQEMTEFSFSPADNEVAGKFLGQEKSDRWLVTVSTDGSQLKGIEPLGDNADKVQVAWSPNNQVVALSKTGEPSGLFSQEILLIGLHGENFRSLKVEGRGFEGEWSPSGEQLLYSIYSDTTNYRPSLWLVDASGDRVGYNKKQVGLNTWVDKCTMATTENVAYCAVPVNLPEGSGYVRELADGIPDVFYRVDLTTGTSTLLASPVTEYGGGVAATNLSLSGDGRLLYFIDETTGQLRSLQLIP
ncbi:MAG: hypothetical protein ABIJ81_02150 [Patescibacteria group bacterium]